MATTPALELGANRGQLLALWLPIAGFVAVKSTTQSSAHGNCHAVGTTHNDSPAPVDIR